MVTYSNKSLYVIGEYMHVMCNIQGSDCACHVNPNPKKMKPYFDLQSGGGGGPGCSLNTGSNTLQSHPLSTRNSSVPKFHIHTLSTHHTQCL